MDPGIEFEALTVRQSGTHRESRP